MGSHFTRIQQDLFHELKKVGISMNINIRIVSLSSHQNGEPRSVCIALECFSSLFPFTRPSRCSTYAQSLVPVLTRLICRREDSIHEALQDALLKMLPTLVPFMTNVSIKVYR